MSFGVGAVIAIVAELYRRRVIVRNRRRREALAGRIEESAEAAASQDELRERIVTEAAPEERDVAEKQVESFLLDQAPELRAVEEMIMRFPPPLPRAAKRMINHARLLTRIANRRRIFGGEPALEPAHLGKWIVLIERWPEIARAVADDPSLMGRLEDATEEGGLAAALEQCEIHTRPSAELRDLLVGEPRLGHVISRLVHYETAVIG